MTGELTGKIALVTGGARNVGRVIALRLAAEGATVVINHFRSPAEARETAAEIARRGGRAHVIRASVAQPRQREAMFEEIAREFGGLDILVNNAADGRLAASEDVEDAMIDRALDTNLKGGLGCARLAAGLMAGRSGAAIVNVSTLGGGQFVMANYLACGPAKAAVEAMTRYLAVDYAPLGIRVNTAAAGMLKSPVADKFPNAEAMQRATIAATPLRRLGTPEEFAEVVAFLVSPRASWITGQTVLADGGLSTGYALLSPPADAVAVERIPDEVEASGTNSAVTSEVPAADPASGGVPVAEAGVPESAALVADTAAPVPETVDPDDDVIAIVGMGLTVSGANTPEEYWAELVEGAERFMPVPEGRWDNDSFYSPDKAAEDKSYSRHSAFITDFVPHPQLAEELRASGRAPDALESTTLWLRHSVLQALDGVRRRPEDRCSFQAGYTADGSQYLEEATVVSGVLQRMRAALTKRGVADAEHLLAHAESVLRERYPRSVGEAERFFPHRVGYGAIDGILPADTDLMMVDTACSSSLYSVDIGIKGLLEGRHDIAVCGGAFAVGPRGSVLFGKLNGLSARGEVRSLDKTSDGVLFSDGAATVVLKRLSRAKADGDRILATVKAFGSSSDGKGKAIYAPSAAGQELAIRRAQADTRMDGVIPDWVVAHATGTKAGDIAEFTTLRTTLDGPPVQVTSNKSVIGHTGWAAGTSSLIQVLLGLEHDAIPRQHRFSEAPAEFQLDTCSLSIPTDTVAWPKRDTPRIAAISGFGFGGTNAHLVIQEPTAEDLAPAGAVRAAAPHPVSNSAGAHAVTGHSTAVSTRPATNGSTVGGPAAAPHGSESGSASAEFATPEPRTAEHADMPNGSSALPMPPTTPVPRNNVMANGKTEPAGVSTRLAVIAVSSHVPGAPDIDAWLADPAAPTGFGDAYPLPTIKEVKIPPRTMRAIDRCQLMILRSAQRIREQLGDFWTANARDTGVLLGHYGGTRNATLYATRCYLDDVALALRADPELAAAGWLDDVLGDIAADITGLVPPSSEDTFPGMMPNVIPARVANYFGLNGLNMTVDTGFTSAITALDVAGRYLRAGELTVALIGGINGNATPEQRELLAAELPADAVLAEGAFLLAVTTEQTATAAGLPVLGYVETGVGGAGAGVECGARAAGRAASFLGGEGAVGLLSALTSVGESGVAVVACRGGVAASDQFVRVSGPAAVVTEPSAVPGDVAVAAGSEAIEPGSRRTAAAAPVPAAESATSEHRAGAPAAAAVSAHDAETVPGSSRESASSASTVTSATAPEPTRVDVHAWHLLAEPGVVVRPPVSFWPDAPTLVLTDCPGELAAAGVPDSVTVFSVAALPTQAWTARPGVVHVSEVTPETVASLLDTHDPRAQLRHLRVVTALPAEPAADGVSDQRTAGIAVLHDLLFLVAKFRTEALAQPGASSITVLTRAMTGATPHPYVGLFTGFTKVAHLEHPRGLTFALATDRDLPGAIAEAEAESMLERGLPIAYYAAGTRMASRLTVVADETENTPVLERDSVIVAVGGARGITTELMIATARSYGGRFYLLGSSAIDEAPAAYLAMSDAEFASAKREYMRERKAKAPELTPARINAEFQRIGNIRTVRANVRRIEAAGAAAVTYLPCDITDPTAVRDTMARILAAENKIDLLVNAAGLNRSAPIGAKEFAEFRRIRDIKLLGYTHLATALAAHPPRLWCNFGSLLGVTGQVGEVDYASANDFLGTAALFRAQVGGRSEFTVGWTLWGEVGLGANELTKAYFDKSGQYSNMSNDEGAQHFLRQLQSCESRPYVAHLGTAEYGAVDALLPGFLPASPRPFYLDRRVDAGVVEDRPWAVFERTFDLERDGYLRDHRVNGAPTLPGAFVAEIAFEAAAALVPGLRVYALEDLTFHHFLKVPETGGPLVKRIRAEVTEWRPDLGQARVAVTVTGDVIAPNGMVLVRDKLHFTSDVLMATVLPAAPRWTDWFAAEETPAVDPYHHPASPVSLTGPFVSTADTRLHPTGKRSAYTLRLEPGDAVFSRFRVPTVLLDGLLRTGVLADGADGTIPVAAPLRIGRLDLYEHTNDALAGRAGPVQLYAVLPDEGEGAGSGNRFTAVHPDGRIMLTLKELDWALIGHLDLGVPAPGLDDLRNGRKQLA
ncbi:SDR family oxidoreductase [Nocardia puris]|uniref:SDR family oxidoreductase n=1 Tax=Nocardia puris TaxID=208602 RepID=UPI0018933405|nr:SDR family oxidoreductase [Nocardia puris]MBF6212887.1 SDR family oxidoreductase [Nocardia puris]MBF6367878.1 SDR family oxidoreductase [Nocardia puris]MBF6463227.1 SDR family oxidoreductase [Nocardia puris]